LEPPFLELQYYLGRAEVGSALRVLVDNIRDGVIPAKLVVPNAVGLSQKAEEIEVVGGVVVLRTEGEAFCGPARQAARLKKLGGRVYKRFVQVADEIAPAYGAIAVEYSLEEPQALRQDPRSLAFRDFFVSRTRLSSNALDDVLQHAGDDVYVEERKAGVYVSMTAEFNPRGCGIPSSEAQERSARISAIIGRAVR
jgi:hypothetical protein